MLRFKGVHVTQWPSWMRWHVPIVMGHFHQKTSSSDWGTFGDIGSACWQVLFCSMPFSHRTECQHDIWTKSLNPNKSIIEIDLLLGSWLWSYFCVFIYFLNAQAIFCDRLRLKILLCGWLFFQDVIDQSVVEIRMQGLIWDSPSRQSSGQINSRPQMGSKSPKR